MFKGVMGKMKLFFPGKNYKYLILSIFLLFLVSIFDIVGVAAILPVIQVAAGQAYDSGYLGVIWGILSKPERNTFVLLLAIVLVMSFVLKGIITLLIKWYVGKFIARLRTETSVTILRSYAYEGYVENKNRNDGEAIYNSGEAVTATYMNYVSSFVSIVSDIGNILLLAVFLFILMPAEAAFAFVFFGLSSWLVQKNLQKKNIIAGKRSLLAAIQTHKALLFSLHGFRENIMHGTRDRFLYKYQVEREESSDMDRLKAFYFEAPKYILEIIFIIGITLVLALMMLTKGSDSAAMLLVFAAACVRILPSFTRIVGAMGSMRNSSAASNVVADELRKSRNTSNSSFFEEPKIGAFAYPNESVEKIDVKVDGIKYRYPDGDRDVLNGINIDIPSGTSVAFVGGSGSGKTTLVDIILGLLEPRAGKISVNNRDIKDNLDNWYQKIGYVPQDVFLSEGTVRGAVAFGLEENEIDDARVREVLDIAELLPVIDQLPEGIYSEIGENGSRLSGGQRQRLGLARALYRRPSVLLLDEATSALDNETENKITQSIEKLSGDITVIIVAHRLSTVRNVDQLLFMSNGEIVARGNFNEVKEKNPEFAKLVELGQLPE